MCILDSFLGFKISLYNIVPRANGTMLLSLLLKKNGPVSSWHLITMHSLQKCATESTKCTCLLLLPRITQRKAGGTGYLKCFHILLKGNTICTILFIHNLLI